MRTRVAVFSVLCCALALHAKAQAASPVHWSANAMASPHTNKQDSYRPGQKLWIALQAQMDPGWHLYSFPQPPGSPVHATQITVADGQPFAQAGNITSPKPESRMDPTVGTQTEFYTDAVTFHVPVKVNKGAPDGKQEVSLEVKYQMCNDRLCLPPRTEKVEASVEIQSRPGKN